MHKALASYATAVVWMRDPDGAIRRALEQAGVSRVACFPGLPPEGWNRHASLYYLACLGIEHAQPPQPLPQSLLYSANAERKHRVYLHPGSGSKRKNWPIEQFAALARRLTAVHLEIRWILGPAEEDAELPAGANPVRCDSLLALARLLAQARLYVGNDSGITHLAALCGCPTLAIFGPSNPRVWAPLGQSVQVMHGRPWPDVQQVVAAAEAIARPAANKRRRSSR
ncbi:MAG: hypothetical protein HYV26_23270 [Candidatus Hydrogenedentes bacterium]|nr:hypothetical protein [Candidatus Hydrogenedentota bacterium]